MTSELVKWFEVVTREIGSGQSMAFRDVDLHVAAMEFRRLIFMVENGLGPEDMKRDAEESRPG